MSPHPILVGLFNPYSQLSADALAPIPPTSSGARIRDMLAKVHPRYGDHYRVIFERHNLARSSIEIDRRDVLADRASRLLEMSPSDCTIVLLGEQVREAFGTALRRPIDKTFIHPQRCGPYTFRVIPHPSGRSTLYNCPTTRTLVGLMLRDLCDEWAEGSKLGRLQ